MISGLFIIFFFLFIGNITSQLLNLPIPGSVIGMVLLTVSLKLRIVKLESVKESADVLVKNMAFLFIPPGVGVMVYFDLISKEFGAILISFFISSILVLVSVGILQQYLSRKDHK